MNRHYIFTVFKSEQSNNTVDGIYFNIIRLTVCEVFRDVRRNQKEKVTSGILFNCNILREEWRTG